MSFMKKTNCRRGAWILGLGLAFCQAAHAGDLASGCRAAMAAPALIEVLPALIPNDNLELNDSPRQYVGSTCSLQSVPYAGGFTIYKVWLHEGNNNIAFRLD